MCMAKSPNKHNRVYAKGDCLEEGLSDAIEDNKVTFKDDPKQRSKYLHDEYGWDRDLGGQKLW